VAFDALGPFLVAWDATPCFSRQTSIILWHLQTPIFKATGFQPFVHSASSCNTCDAFRVAYSTVLQLNAAGYSETSLSI